MFKPTIENRIEELESTSLRYNNPEYLILHSTRSYPEFEDLQEKHKGQGWAGVGYHLFISKSNKISQSRPFDKEGAHALGFNTNSIGLCFYAPKSKLKLKQIWKGKNLIKDIKKIYPDIKLISHSTTQIIYMNRLLKDYGIDKQFDTTQKTYNQTTFNKTKKEIDHFVGMLSTEKHYDLKQRMKLFTNCPGELYNNFK